jgi:hypothetical protein
MDKVNRKCGKYAPHLQSECGWLGRSEYDQYGLTLPEKHSLHKKTMLPGMFSARARV